MRKAVLMLLLVAVATPSSAEWEKVGETKEKSFYFDPAKIVKNGDLRKIWEVQNLKIRDKTGVMSRRLRVEYNCESRHSRILLASAHSETMGDGKLLDSPNSGSGWNYITPGTPSETILKRVCVK